MAVGTTLVVTTLPDGKLLFLDQQTGEVEEVIELEPGALDGMRLDGQGGYFVSQFQGRVLRVHRSRTVDIVF